MTSASHLDRLTRLARVDAFVRFRSENSQASLFQPSQWAIYPRRTIGGYVADLGLRTILAWEFYESGLVKFNGDNWFASVQDEFLFPFNIVPVGVSWFIATWAELIGGLALLFGIATRFFAVTLLVLTIVAAAAVHWPDTWNTLGELLQGYSIRNNGFGNYKLPALFAVMLVPLIFYGPGRVSVDHLIMRWLGNREAIDYSVSPSAA